MKRQILSISSKKFAPGQPEVILWLTVQPSLKPAPSRLLPKAQLSSGGRGLSGSPRPETDDRTA
jgi:hypothetical protein